MKAKVVKVFRDKYTKQIYKEGEVIEITKKRYTEILKVDKTLIKEIKEEKELKNNE